jgi:hypothetical protein
MMQKYQTVPKNSYCTFCKSVGHDDKDCRTMELMRERTSDAYRVQAEMMTGQETPQFNQAPAPYNTAQQQYNTAQQPYNNVQATVQPDTTPVQYRTSIIRHHSITHREVIAQATEEEDEPEEVSDMVEDQSHVTIVSNQDIMHENAHCHQ